MSELQDKCSPKVQVIRIPDDEDQEDDGDDHVRDQDEVIRG